MKVQTVADQTPPRAANIDVLRNVSARQSEVLTANALDFVAALHRAFDGRRRQLLQARAARREQWDRGVLPDFDPETTTVRSSEWTVADIPSDLQDRRVEITGPVDRKMIINALNSGANVFMADFEDSNAPTFENNISGQINLRDAVRGTIEFVSPQGKEYSLNDTIATLVVRPRGWHLNEKHVTVDGDPVSASLFDFGLFFYHNAQAQLDQSSGPYFYLPKLEHYLEARLWNDVFVFAQQTLGIPQGSIRATVLIEHVLAAFQMDEILWELRDHSAGLNCGRWDYIFSFIKSFRAHAEYVLPDRASVGMDRHFLSSYVKLLIHTCHRRGVHAMGGMAAQIPVRDDPAANDAAMQRVRQDKLREVQAGHDGTWVAHPGLVPVAREIFDAHLSGPNQIDRTEPAVVIEAHDLMAVPDGMITEAGLRHNIDVGIRYLDAWLSGLGCVPLYNLMEDAATAEISRSQLWQWVHHGAALEDGSPVTTSMVQAATADVVLRIREERTANNIPQDHLPLAARLFEDLVTADELEEFMTLRAYEHLD